MQTTETIQVRKDHGTDIPPGVDAFLRMLAQWTVEDVHFKPAVAAVNIEETQQ